MTQEINSYLNEVLDFLEHHSVRKERVDWAALKKEVLALSEHARTTAETYPAIKLALKRLGDHHSFFLTPEEWRLWREGTSIQAGPGLLAVYPEGVVVQVYPGSAAEQAGVRIGDSIESLNGKQILTLGSDTFHALLCETPLSLKLRRAKMPNLLSMTLTSKTYSFALKPRGRRLADDIGYLDLPGLTGTETALKVYASTAQKIIREVDQRATRGWVVDLRCNTGGNMFPMLAGVGPIVGDGELGSFMSPDGSKDIWTYHQGIFRVGEWVGSEVEEPCHLKHLMPPVAVLISRLTRSSGELTLLAFCGRPLTRTFGEPTAGLPTANQGHSFSDGAVLHLTVALGADRTGQIYESAIHPDQPVKVDWTLLRTKRDPVLQAALQWLHSLD